MGGPAAAPPTGPTATEADGGAAGTGRPDPDSVGTGTKAVAGAWKARD